MRTVTIRRCPVCHKIGNHANQLATEFLSELDIEVSIVDGNKGEFTVDVDRRKVNAKEGESLRAPSEIAAEIRGVPAAAR